MGEVHLQFDWFALLNSSPPSFKHLQVVKGAEMQGATKIIGVDLRERKGEKGMSLGMTDFINPTEDGTKSLSERIKEMTGGDGVDYSFECTGVSHLLNQALESTRVVRTKNAVARIIQSSQINTVMTPKCVEC